MSDLNKVSEDIKNQNNQQNEDQIVMINDELKFTSITNSTLENNSKENQLESNKEFVKIEKVESYDEDDSEYEDVEEDDEMHDTCLSNSMPNKNSLKTSVNDDDDEDVDLNIKPRRIHKKREDDEHSEEYETDDDNKNPTNTKSNVPVNVEKKEKNKEIVVDDTNAQSPAYVPRKGKFYEHDDRTADGKDRSKQGIPKYVYQLYRDSDAKWQHDLYFQDEEVSKSRYPLSKATHRSFEYGNQRHRERFYANDRITRSQWQHNSYHAQRNDNHDSHRQVSYKTYSKLHNNRMNNNTDLVKDNRRPLSKNPMTSSQRVISNDEKAQVMTHQQKQQNPNNPYHIDERVFHRRRNFTNSQFQQQNNELKVHDMNRSKENQKRFDEKPNEYNQFKYNNGKNQQDNHSYFKKYDFNENKNNLPPRLQLANHKRNFIQKQYYQQNQNSSLSSDLSTIERPKRYSNMRSNMIINPLEQQPLSSKSKLHQYQDLGSHNLEHNDWPQAPPPPTLYLPQQHTSSQTFYQHQKSQYMSLNYT